MNRRNSIAFRLCAVCCAPFCNLTGCPAMAATIVDEQGQPVAQFESMLNTADQGCTRWEKGIDGVYESHDGFREAQVVDLLVRAEGYASTIVRFAGDKRKDISNPDVKVTLKRGLPVELRFQLPEGMKWPKDARPEVYFADIHWRATIMRQPSNRKQYKSGAAELDFGMLVTPAGANTFKVQLAADKPPFYVAIHQPGFLQFFEGGPFTMADVKEGVLNVTIPKPLRLAISFKADGAPESLPFNEVYINVLMKLAGTKESYIDAASETFKSPNDATLSLNDLVPGDYRYLVSTTPKPDTKPLVGDKVNPGSFFAADLINLKAGGSEKIDVKYEPPNLEAARGDRTAVLHIQMPDGSPAVGKEISVDYIDEHYRAMPVFSGRVPKDGTVTLDNLTDRKGKLATSGAYFVQAGEHNLIGYINIADDKKKAEYTYHLPLAVGDTVPDLDLIEVGTGRHMKFADTRGKIVWLEFWATWCGPCQPAMSELVKTVGEHGGEWADTVSIIPLSVDDSVEIVARHVKDRAWDTIPHYWSEAGADKSGFGSTAANTVGVHSVPTAYLVGRDGRILWTGHPLADATGNKTADRIKAVLEK